MPLNLHVEDGGEKYLPFAKKALVQMKAWMLAAGLRSHTKHYLVSTGERILINALFLSGVFSLDFIRITVKKEAGTHLVVRTGLHQWTFFNWDFSLKETFDVPDGTAYKGAGSQGTQICAAAADKLLIGTGTSYDDGTSQYWIVSATGSHALVAGPRSGTDFYRNVYTSEQEGRWARTASDRFVHWAFGTHPGDNPFDGSGWWATVVNPADFTTFSQVTTITSDPDNAPAPPLANGALGHPGTFLRDDPNTGFTVYHDNFFSGTRFYLANPLDGNPCPDTEFNTGGADGGISPHGTPGRYWRCVTDAGVVKVRIYDTLGVQLAEASLSPSTAVLTWVADDKKALVLAQHGAPAVKKAWLVEEGVDGMGNPILTATEVTGQGVLGTVVSADQYWNAQSSSALWGEGIHLVNRTF